MVNCVFLYNRVLHLLEQTSILHDYCWERYIRMLLSKKGTSTHGSNASLLLYETVASHCCACMVTEVFAVCKLFKGSPHPIKYSFMVKPTTCTYIH